jgi:hypothetical protein
VTRFSCSLILIAEVIAATLDAFLPSQNETCARDLLFVSRTTQKGCTEIIEPLTRGEIVQNTHGASNCQWVCTQAAIVGVHALNECFCTCISCR